MGLSKVVVSAAELLGQVAMPRGSYNRVGMQITWRPRGGRVLELD
jgi:hypothetical protein